MIKRRGFFGRLFQDPLTAISFAVVVLYIVLGVLAHFHLIYPLAAEFHHGQEQLPPSFVHWFGTDLFGRDVFAKGIYGTRTALLVGGIASLIAIPIGTLLGALGGYFGGKVDAGVVWIYTTVDSVPSILLVIALAYALGPGLMNAYIAIGASSWVNLCRLVRAEFFRHREQDYVLAAQALGASHLRRIWKHILPNMVHIILLQISLSFVYAIKTEVILSYLGLGAEAGQFSWGLMIDESKQTLVQGIWWELACATLLMFGLILALNLFNDGLARATRARQI